VKAIRYFLDQAWTLAGTGLVLITLSGSTRTAGIWLSVSALLLHFVSYLIPEDKETEE
jgi:hypothetical protein